MARLFGWLPLCLLFIATTFVSPGSSAQTPPVNAPAQKGKKQTESGSKKTPPASAQTQPKGVQPQPVAPQANAQNQPAAQTQQANAQTQPANGQAQPQNTQPPQITGVNVFQTAATPDGNASFYLEISGQSLPTASPVVFLAPQKGVTGTLDVVSAKDSQIVVKFTASKDYFPSTVGLAGTGGAIYTKDVDQNANVNSTLPRIDDIEVLQLNRVVGTGSIKIDGAHFGTDVSKISVAIVPRDPALPAFRQVPPTTPYSCPSVTPAQQITPPITRSAKDDIVVVDFSFPCVPGYSVPFRIARVLLTVTGTSGGPSTTASYEMLPGRDENLTYRSTIMSFEQASSRFGRGIASNFYVVQLSITNKGSVKMQIPLASIQAEVEWYAGTVGSRYYREGPPTVAPVPLAGAVSYFSIDRQAWGRRARFFNFLQGLTTIGSAIQLFFGPGFAQGVGIAGGGFRQGMGQIIPDLSDQQLANLTSQSFESIETVSGNGGTIDKVVFIQRSAGVLASAGIPTKFRSLVSNVLSFEINGYEVPVETKPKVATANP
jgi:hypothetical protein